MKELKLNLKIKKMKNFKLHAAFIVMFIGSYNNNIFAQTNSRNIIPDNVIVAITAKYPNAEIKNWESTNNEYTAKVKENGHKFYATFDKNSQWIKTTSQVSRWRNLPANVRATFKESKYASWRVDKLKKVEAPSGDFYQVLVDNLYQQIDADHMGFAENYVLNFRPSGEIFAEQNISSPLLF